MSDKHNEKSFIHVIRVTADVLCMLQVIGFIYM